MEMRCRGQEEAAGGGGAGEKEVEKVEEKEEEKGASRRKEASRTAKTHAEGMRTVEKRSNAASERHGGGSVLKR